MFWLPSLYLFCYVVLFAKLLFILLLSYFFRKSALELSERLYLGLKSYVSALNRIFSTFRLSIFFGYLPVELLPWTVLVWESKDGHAYFLKRSVHSGRGRTGTVLQSCCTRARQGVNGGLLFHIGWLGRAPLKRQHVSRAGMLWGTPGDRAPGRGHGKASALRWEPFCFYKGKQRNPCDQVQWVSMAPKGKGRFKMKGWGAYHHYQTLGFYSKMGGPEGLGAERATCLNSVFSRTTLACCPKVTVETVKRYRSHSGKRQW